MSSERVLARASLLAAGQWGLLTTAQAEREGVTRVQLSRLAEAGVLERVDHGVYAMTSSSSEHRALRAAWLVLEPGSTAEERLADPISSGVISHTSAAGLHGLGDLLDDQPEITVQERKQTRRGIRLHRLPLTEAEVTLVDGLPTTTEERTVVDLLRGGHDLEHVAQIVGQGARRGVVDLDDLAARLDPLARRYEASSGRDLLEHLLDLVGLNPASLARDLAASAPGRELIAAGQYAGASTALRQLLESIAPHIDAARALTQGTGAGFAGVQSGMLAGIADSLKAIQPRHTMPSFTSPLASMLADIDLSAFSSVNAPGFRAALTAAHAPLLHAAQSPLIKATQSSLAASPRQREEPRSTTEDEREDDE